MASSHLVAIVQVLELSGVSSILETFVKMTEKSRVLFILHLPPPVHGASMVGKYIHDSEKVKEAFDARFVNLTTASSLEDVGKGGWKKLWHFCEKLREIKRAIKAQQPDWVYVTPNSAGGPFYKDYVVVQLCKRWTKGHVVLHFHNKGVQTRQERWLDDKLYRRFFKGVKVILLGKPLYEDVKKYVDEKDVWYCANGIPDNGACPEERVHEIPHILWLTNIMRTKGLMEYLEALKILKERGYRFQADFVGGLTKEVTGDEFELALTTHGLNDCTSYVGKKYGPEKEAYFREADIFVLPSYTEAFPLTILEAMQWGVPVVASNVGGVSTSVDDGATGLLIGGNDPVMTNIFRPDPVEIADKLETLLKDPVLRKRMGENGYKKYKEHFTLAAFETQFVGVLNDMAEITKKARC